MSTLKNHLMQVEAIAGASHLYEFAPALIRHGAVPVADPEGTGKLAGKTGSGLRLIGVVHAENVAQRWHPPETTARVLASRTQEASVDMSPGEAASRLLEDAVRAMPVVDGDHYVGLVTERSLMTMPAITSDRRAVEELASNHVTTVTEDRTLGHARALMREKRIGRLPVVDQKGYLMGLVEWPHLISTEAGKDDEKRVTPIEYRRMTRLQVTAVMDWKPLEVGSKDPAGEVAQRMQEHDQSAAVLVENNRPVGIVTCGDLLEPAAAEFARTTEGLYVQIAGLDGVDTFERQAVDSVIQEHLARVASAVRDPEYLYLHVKSYHEEGSRQKWSIRARLADAKGTLNARSYAYNLPEAVDLAMDRLSEIAKDQRERRLDLRGSASARTARKMGY